MAELTTPYTSCWVAMTMDDARFFDTEAEARAAGMDHVGRVRLFIDDTSRIAKHLLRSIDWQLAEDNYCDELGCDFDRAVMPEPDLNDDNWMSYEVTPHLRDWLKRYLKARGRETDWYFVPTEDWEEKAS